MGQRVQKNYQLNNCQLSILTLTLVLQKIEFKRGLRTIMIYNYILRKVILYALSPPI